MFLPLIEIYDVGIKKGVVDRYTVVLLDKGYGESPGYNVGICLSENPDSSKGVSHLIDVKRGSHLGKRISFSELPINVQKHVKEKLQTGLRSNIYKTIFELKKLNRHLDYRNLVKAIITVEEAKKYLNLSDSEWKQIEKNKELEKLLSDLIVQMDALDDQLKIYNKLFESIQKRFFVPQLGNLDEIKAGAERFTLRLGKILSAYLETKKSFGGKDAFMAIIEKRLPKYSKIVHDCYEQAYKQGYKMYTVLEDQMNEKWPEVVKDYPKKEVTSTINFKRILSVPKDIMQKIAKDIYSSLKSLWNSVYIFINKRFTILNRDLDKLEGTLKKV